MVYRSARLWSLLLSWLLFSALLLGTGLAVLAAPEEESQEEPAPALETVAADLNQIEAEPGINALGEEMTESSVDYYALAMEAIERAYMESLAEKLEETTEESTISLEEDFLAQPELAEVRAAADPVRAASPTMPKSKAYLLELDGVQYYAWFPSGSTLGVSDEGYIYNEGSANISAVISTSLDGVSLGGYNDFITIAPLLASSSNNNAFRYGSRVYITDYYVQGNTLYNNVTYIGSAKMIDKPGAGYGFSSYQLVVFAALLLIVIMLFMRGNRR